MKPLLMGLDGLREFGELISAVENGRCPVAAGGLNQIHKAHVAAALGAKLERPLFVLCPDDLEAAAMARDLAAFMDGVLQLPSREYTFHGAEVMSRDWEHQRISALSALRAGRGAVVASLEAASGRTMTPETMEKAAVTLRPGEVADLLAIEDILVRGGYRRADRVEGPGQFAVRGGILDVFPPAAENPVRVEFFGDEVDTLSAFDSVTQRRTESVESLVILPAAETLPDMAPGGITGLLDRMASLLSKGKKNDVLNVTVHRDIERLENDVHFAAADRYLGLIYPELSCALDFLAPETLVVIMDHGRLRERSKSLQWSHGEDIQALIAAGVLHPELAEFYLPFEAVNSRLTGVPVVMLDAFVGSAYDLPPRAITGFTAKQLPAFGGSLETAESDIRHYIGGGYRTVIFCQTETRARHLGEALTAAGIPHGIDLTFDNLPEPGSAVITTGPLQAGFDYPAVKFAALTEGTMSERGRRKPKKKTARERVRSYADLTPGDMVVHEHHGLAKFQGVVKMDVDGAERDYIKLQFLGTDMLYVPATQLDVVSKYIGAGEGASVRLSKLGGAEWTKQKSRAKAAARELAKELIELYAERRRKPGYVFPPDSEWQVEFEEAFEYEETDDQLRCAREIKNDMQAAFPMDRLLCGDVGFGKTEVALRAAMKCVLAGKQVAFLVPTTVLCLQHYETAVKRFQNYPVTVDMMSRFRTKKQMTETAKRVEQGRVDILIGTHRILQKDITFKDLGLLIIDEEQRFGVTHKERLKEMSRGIDALTLTATPIPRTLNMALSGIRDMSSIEEAPRDRQPVQTYVLEHDYSVLYDAIRREVGRGGQVYFLHNRVESIDRALSRITREFPDLSCAVAHGQMGEEALSDVMHRMSEGQIDVLVCTTIIETGIDIANVNTLIVEDADRLGLAQLHQIRGRVGRSQRRAYAYLTYRRGKVLTEIAEKRLNAIREFAEFGAGFKIAMRDLEIRGAGNILGHAQSGHMMNVGYDMYLKLLEEAVLEERGETAARPQDCTADIAVSAAIPESYVPSAEERMDLYRRIALVRTEEDASDVIDELCDRYGDLPPVVHALLRIALLRATAALCGITEISQKVGHMLIALPQPDIRVVSALCAAKNYKGRLFFSAGDKPYLSLRLHDREDVLKTAEDLIAAFHAAGEAEEKEGSA
ncbi:transcription-repair coupling factor [Oscillospiraceae bacterium OttesenSCG-928-F05]|nr:transcription-repair coupling factor [Oscillospiraceae bacterium OttesenSCG-928-F05]